MQHETHGLGVNHPFCDFLSNTRETILRDRPDSWKSGSLASIVSSNSGTAWRVWSRSCRRASHRIAWGSRSLTTLVLTSQRQDPSGEIRIERCLRPRLSPFGFQIGRSVFNFLVAEIEILQCIFEREIRPLDVSHITVMVALSFIGQELYEVQSFLSIRRRQAVKKRIDLFDSIHTSDDTRCVRSTSIGSLRSQRVVSR